MIRQRHHKGFACTCGHPQVAPRCLWVLVVLLLSGCIADIPGDEAPPGEPGPSDNDISVSIIETGCTTAWADIPVDRDEALMHLPAGFTPRGPADGPVLANLMSRSCIDATVSGVALGPSSLMFLMLRVTAPPDRQREDAAEHFFVVWGASDQAAFASVLYDHGLGEEDVAGITMARHVENPRAVHVTTDATALDATLAVSALDFGDYGVFTTRLFGRTDEGIVALDKERTEHRAAPLGDAVVRLEGPAAFSPGTFAGMGRFDLWNEDEVSYRWVSATG